MAPTTDDPHALVLETSGRRGLVAVARGDRLLAARALDESRRNARDLAPAAADLLAAAGLRPRQLDLVIVSLGPGSYTGLRVGVMSAKALAYATGCALIGVETFAALALQAPPGCHRLDVLADAQKDLVYLQSFTRDGAAWRAATPLAITPFEDWLARRDPSAWVTGPGLDKYGPRVPADAPLVAPELREPGAAALLALGLGRFRADLRDDPFALAPIYLRPSSAEEQWRGKP